MCYIGFQKNETCCFIKQNGYVSMSLIKSRDMLLGQGKFTLLEKERRKVVHAVHEWHDNQVVKNRWEDRGCLSVRKMK